jgi:hypothetical protein
VPARGMIENAVNQQRKILHQAKHGRLPWALPVIESAVELTSICNVPL